MTSDGQYEIVVDLIADAEASGATKLCGGPVDVPGLPGKFVAPTVLTGVTHEMRIMREEIFGPVLPIVVVDSEQEAIDLANDSEFGLGASVWTKDRQKGERIARRIESGMVSVNDHSFSHGACQCAWGGVKDSGVGRSHSKFGFYECVNIKMNSWEPGLTRDFWWHPYDRTLGEAVRASATLLYGKGAARTKALRKGAGPLLQVGRRTLRKRGGSAPLTGLPGNAPIPHSLGLPHQRRVDNPVAKRLDQCHVALPDATAWLDVDGHLPLVAPLAPIDPGQVHRAVHGLVRKLRGELDVGAVERHEGQGAEGQVRRRVAQVVGQPLGQ